MGLSRLENFLKSSRGKILHVNPENLDSSDSVSNDGASPFTPFKTINRALIECARYSYQVGLENDRFGFCTILLYSGEHLVDNRPGLVIEDDGTGYIRSGASAVLNQFDINTALDITDPSNQLYLLNSVHGGVIVPRGTSIVAQDLRKTVIRPLYVPDPRNENIERSSIFRITGASFFFSFSVLDANPGGFCYKNYSNEKYTPNFSHHKLTAFEYVDGVNKVNINDTFLNLNTTRTDLDQYYEKISLVYGASSGREIDNVNYIGGVSVDIQPVIDEFRIVGPRGDVVGISSIISGDGTTPSSRITVTVDGNVEGISVDTSVQISGVNVNGYDGQFVVSAVPSENQIQYITPTIPTTPSPTIFGATVNIISDTISSASPYVFNVSLRSVYGMCGLHADGSKVGGFKSVVVAQFTAVSLQKDNDAFVIYNEEAGTYLDAVSVPDLYKNTKARYKPEAENFHIKVSNDAFAQLVSVFSIGYGAQIIAESGGDYSITNSNSNFGAKTFISSGYKKDAFDQDDHGYIVGVIPPEEIPEKYVGLEFPQIDVGLTTSVSAGAATTNKLYFYNQTTLDSPPAAFVDGFRIGAKVDDYLNIEFPVETSSKIVIPNTNSSYEKSFVVQRQNNNFENSISNGVITLTEAHSFGAIEKIRVIAQNGHLPDGINPDQIYYVINSTIDNSLSNAQIKLAVTSNNAINNIPILPNRKGGKLFVVSRVADKAPGEPGHPIQWDSSRNNWYISVDENDNNIYDNILNRNSFVTGRSFILRTPDNRVEENKLYKLLYCIPKNTSTSARPPVNGFIVQESNDSSLSGTEFDRYFGTSDLVSDTEIRNPKFISRASWNATEVTITTELPHKLNVGDLIEVVKVIPSGYNGSYTVTKTPNSRTFTYSLDINPGIFTNDTRVRNSDLPFVKRKNTRNIFQIYKSEEVQKYVRDKQDGLYELTVTHSSVVPTIAPFTNLNFSQPIKNLYPQLDRDNINSNPNQTECFADHNVIGNIVVNDPKNSISRESFNKLNSDLFVGIGITGIRSNQNGLTHTLYTAVDHSLSGITSVSVVSAGTSYVPGTYYGVGVTTTSGGESAAFKVVIDGTQSISSIEIMSGGSNYSVGNILSVVSGIGTTTGFVPANLSVTAVTNNINNSISINGFIGDYFDYNQTYRIDAVNNSKRIVISSYAPVSGASTIIIPQNAFGRINGNIVNVNSLVYDNFAGISTLITSDPHGLKPNTRIKLTGFDSPFYNKDVIISSVDSITQIQVNSGISSFIPPTTGASQVIPLGISPIIGNDRLEYYYSGITTTSGFILNVDDSDLIPFNIRNAAVTGLKKGDYIESNGEVMRIKANIDSDFVDVYRSQFGTDKKTHPVGSVVKKINVIPVELRRNSIIRASGHTFEYVGYGAGNYSTSLPENQDREIDKIERLISQSTKLSGGTVYYTGMDENGDFYSANRKLSSSTGEQEIYDLPAPTVVAESSIDDSFNVIDSQKVIVSDSLKVDGGEKNDIVSIFNGPIVINEKLTSYSEKGIEVSSLFMKGDQNISRRHSISTDFPSFAGNYGDIIYNASPEEEGNIGWVYTTDDEWRTWGFVGDLGTNLRIFSESEPNPIIGDIVSINSSYNGLTVRGSLYYPTSNFIGSNLDVIVLYHPSIDSQGLTPSNAALNFLNIVTNTSQINIRDKIVFSVAYPQDAIPAWLQNNSLINNEFPELLGNYGGSYANFKFGDNVEYAEAALLWVKNDLNSYLSGIGVSKTINRLFTFGHSQGAYLTHRLNTMHQVDGVISNAPGPIDLLTRCSTSESQGDNNITCLKIKTSLGSTSVSPGSYTGVSLSNFLSGTLSPALFTQALDDTTGNSVGTPQVANMQTIVQPGLESCVNCAPVEFKYYATGGHAAFVTNSQLQSDIRQFFNSVPPTGESVLEGIVDQLKFVGDKNGLVDILFDINVDVEVNQNAGFGTVSMKIPIRPINFSTSALGRNTPKFNNRSSGTRVIYYESLDATNVDYATGISTNVMWYSIPRNTSIFSFKWFGGETELMSLTGDGKLSVFNSIIANLEGNASTATTAVNLDRSVTAGEGLTGGGSLNGQSVTLNVGQGSGITVSSNSVAVDDTVVRTTGVQDIGGAKNFTSNMSATNITASNDITADKFIGKGITPVGGIIMWSGAVSSIPSGWALCNGANGTPNLRNRFIVGAGGDYNPGDAGGSNSVTLTTAQIPEHSHSSSTGSAGDHTHGGSTGSAGGHTHGGSTGSAGGHTHGGSTGSAGGHTHGGSALTGGSHTHTYSGPDGTISFGVGAGSREAVRRAETQTTSTHTGHTHSLSIDAVGDHTHSLSINNAGSHTHTVTIDEVGDHTHSLSINNAGSHTHTVTVENTGGGQSHENRPPYYALAFIMRVA